MNSTKSDNDLMAEFNGCSREAYNMIFHRYKNRLLNYIMKSYSFSKDDAEDMTQKTLIRVFEYKYKYESKYQFSTWIFTVARNFVLNEISRNKPVYFDNEDQAKSTIAKELIVADKNYDGSNEILLRCMQQLDEKYREVLTLRYIEDMSYEEIGDILGIKVNTLKSHCKRGLEQLKIKVLENGLK